MPVTLCERRVETSIGEKECRQKSNMNAHDRDMNGDSVDHASSDEYVNPLSAKPVAVYDLTFVTRYGGMKKQLAECKCNSTVFSQRTFENIRLCQKIKCPSFVTVPPPRPLY